MSDDTLQRFDQSLAFIMDNFPAAWWRMFERLKEVGFTEEQALSILRTYVFAQTGGKMMEK